ncbi:DMT family transporter [Roseovarius nanhaiticus]|uniref:DMT family transporter n=1 Tax=Roseovarius nanhaiticus TaxID=573024 RepID=UPI0024938F2A|nr:DMT family transporter [Roseovarius nanhaiticus]
MASLAFGLVAALCWGIHDICVRYVSQRTGILPALATVLIIGTIVMAPAAFFMGDWRVMDIRALMLSAASGIAFTLAYLGLYKAFEIGPVRLVAPIIGAYPILSVGWAAASGQAVTADQWLAVAAVIAGVAIVGMLTDEAASSGNKRTAILWAMLGGTAFAATFALGQAAAHAGSEAAAIFITRVVAVALALVLLVGSGGIRWPARSALPLLGLMGVLDCIALGIVIAAASMARPEFASVAASTFGMITVILAWAILRERMTPGQWAGVVLTFLAIGYLAT